jgi:hypothetical protein
MAPYETERPLLADIMKKKLRERAKRQEKMGFGGGGGGMNRRKKTFVMGEGKRGKRKS